MAKIFRQDRKLWFRGFKKLIRLRYRRPRYIYLGEKPTTNSIVLANHVGATGPLLLESYGEFPFRMWGTHEMNSGLRKLYNYQTKIYYHQKKGWNIHLARLFCLLASPLTYLFYKGLRLISTYRDARLKRTLKESITVMKNGENIVIFPEMSEEGYFDELRGFYSGFALLAETFYKRGMDVLIYTSYYRRKDKVHIFDKPIRYSELKKIATTREEMANYLLNKSNALGKMELPALPV